VAALIEPSQAPERAPLIPLVGTVLFLAGVLPVSLGTPKTIAAAREAVARRGGLVVVSRAYPLDGLDGELLTIGTLARVVEAAPSGDRLRCSLQGLLRVRTTTFVRRTPFFEVTVAQLEREAPLARSDLESFRAGTASAWPGSPVAQVETGASAPVFTTGDQTHLGS
jgi:Lon protease-like protein